MKKFSEPISSLNDCCHIRRKSERVFSPCTCQPIAMLPKFHYNIILREREQNRVGDGKI